MAGPSEISEKTERVRENIALLLERLRWRRLTTPVRNSDVVVVKLEE
ncbi:MAG: hypothetical protein GF353_11260, partial [Candidatus Lokiarchaeota archaeon]|nr:hypothetical protein [Candidatus Lokiarchaeota archaeon]